MNNISIKYRLKLLAIICYILISLSVYLAYINPAKGYELSIYQSTPSIIWIFLIISILGGVTLIFHQVYSREYENNNFWLFGFLILILSRISLLYIPYIRGYYGWMGDHNTHMGHVKDIISTGHFGKFNFYPITHILLAEIKFISGVSIELLANYSTALISVFYVISIYLLAKSTLSQKNAQLLSVATVGGVLFDGCDVFLFPMGWSARYLPFFILIFFKSIKSLEYKLLLIIMLITYPLFHLFSATVLVIILLTIGFTRAVFILIESEKPFLNNILQRFPFTQVLIILVILFPWILSFRRFYPNVRNLSWSFNTGQGRNTIDWMNSLLDKVGIHGIEFVKLLVREKGDDIIFLILSFVAAAILFKNYKNNKDLEHYQNLIILISITLVIGLAYTIYLFNIIPGLLNIAFGRLQLYLILLTPVFAGYSFQKLLRRSRTPIIASLSIFIIMTASIISIFSLYSSPYTFKPNAMVTQIDMDGFKWIIIHDTENIEYVDIMSRIKRFADPILGIEKTKEYLSTPIPDHFNYTIYSTLGESYQEDKYAVLTQRDKVIYDTVWKIWGRFDKEDFDKLENDKTVDKIYTNGASDIWYIHGIKVREK